MSGGLLVQPPFKVRKFSGVLRVAFAGDSNTAFRYDTTKTVSPPTLYANAMTYIGWLGWYSKQRFYTDTSMNVGVGSIGTAHWLATQVPLLLALSPRPDVVCHQIGRNDISDVTVATAVQMIANIQAGLLQLAAAGISSLLLSVTPRSSDTAAQKAKCAEYNRQLEALSYNSAYCAKFVDLCRTFTDFSTTNQPAITGYQYPGDNLHDAPQGGSVKALVVLPALEPFLTAGSRYRPCNASDLFDATLVPSGNLLSNGLMTPGAGVAATNGATGTVPTGWNGRRAANSGATTVAFSTGTDADITTLPTTIITIGGTGDVTAFAILEATSPTFTGLVAGTDSVYAMVDIKVTGLANVNELRLRVSSTNTGTINAESYDGTQSTYPGGTGVSFPAAFPASGVITLQTQPMLLPAGSNGLRWRLEITPLTQGAAMSAVITVSEPYFGKVIHT